MLALQHALLFLRSLAGDGSQCVEARCASTQCSTGVAACCRLDKGGRALSRKATAVKQASVRMLKYRPRVQTVTLNPKYVNTMSTESSSGYLEPVKLLPANLDGEEPDEQGAAGIYRCSG